QLMGTASGLNVALNSTGPNFAATAQAIKEIGGASADSAGNVEGFSKVQKTLSFQVDQVKDKVKAWATEMGLKLIPVLSEALGWLTKHTTVLKVLAAVIGGVLLVAIGAYTASMVA